MSCCEVKKEASYTKELEKLKKYFDEVTLEDKEKYTLLELKDRANRSSYDYIVWLSIKIQKGYTNKLVYSSKTDEEMVEKVCSSILDWIDILKNFEKKETKKQLSLFEELNESNDELEKEPINDGNWGKYSRECERVRKSNLMKQYGFFDLLNIAYYTYSGIDYRKKLPTVDEVRELFKKAISLGKDNPDKDYGWFSFDNLDFLFDNGGLSDYELKNRLRWIRIYLLSYKSFFSVDTDLSYTAFPYKDSVYYRYYLDGTRLSTIGYHDNDKLELPTYDELFDKEFLLWIRDFIGIKNKEVISDEEILKDNIKSFFDSFLWYERNNYNFVEKINTFSNWKEFKKDLYDFCKEKGLGKQNGGCSGCSIDDFGGWINLDKKGNIKVTQDYKTREELKRNTDDLKVDDYGKYIVWDLTGDEIYKKAFELFNKKESAKKTSLFDFAA